MNKLWDKFLLGLSCCAFMLAEGTDPSNITTLLLAVICSAIFQIKPNSAVAYLSVIAYSSLCIFSKEALILAPLVLYEAYQKKSDKWEDVFSQSEYICKYAYEC